MPTDPQRADADLTAVLTQALTDEVLRQTADIMASTMGYANIEGYCDCNGCARYRENAREVLLAALLPALRGSGTTEPSGEGRP